MQSTEIWYARDEAKRNEAVRSSEFGEPFNPKSVEGVQVRRRQAAAIRRRKEEEAEDAEIEARQVAEVERLAKRSFLEKMWDRIFG